MERGITGCRIPVGVRLQTYKEASPRTIKDQPSGLDPRHETTTCSWWRQMTTCSRWKEATTTSRETIAAMRRSSCSCPRCTPCSCPWRATCSWRRRRWPGHGARSEDLRRLLAVKWPHLVKPTRCPRSRPQHINCFDPVDHSIWQAYYQRICQ